VAEILQAQHLDRRCGSFGRGGWGFLVVGVSSLGRTISRHAWRLLPDQQVDEQKGALSMRNRDLALGCQERNFGVLEFNDRVLKYSVFNWGPWRSGENPRHD
jgi:hypothetical protein